ncbi:unnamed protein product, partial [Tetraodon nigroviridis]
KVLLCENRLISCKFRELDVPLVLWPPMIPHGELVNCGLGHMFLITNDADLMKMQTKRRDGCPSGAAGPGEAAPLGLAAGRERCVTTPVEVKVTTRLEEIGAGRGCGRELCVNRAQRPAP